MGDENAPDADSGDYQYDEVHRFLTEGSSTGQDPPDARDHTT